MTRTRQTAAAEPQVDQHEQPLKASRPVTVQILPESHCWEAFILDISVQGARLRSSVAIAPGTQIRVDAPRILLVGAVTHCDPDDGAYHLEMKFLRPLPLLAELERLNAALFREDSPEDSE